ncbi:MAG TPA: hypothetical protein VNS63_22430, partial [Blastocatellia bacterium]|nr:hypothetical protein [Blastocatellia bacterium]
FLLTLVLIVPLHAIADNAPRRVRVSEISKAPMTAGLLTITFLKLSSSPRLGNGRIEVLVENSSTGFATFYPQRLSFVGEDNVQVDVWGTWSGESSIVPPREKSIAPGARAKENYYLDGKLSLPARLYYDEKLLAVITD